MRVVTDRSRWFPTGSVVETAAGIGEDGFRLGAAMCKSLRQRFKLLPNFDAGYGWEGLF
jgi:hypothetical protein